MANQSQTSKDIMKLYGSYCPGNNQEIFQKGVEYCL